MNADPGSSPSAATFTALPWLSVEHAHRYDLPHPGRVEHDTTLQRDQLAVGFTAARPRKAILGRAVTAARCLEATNNAADGATARWAGGVICFVDAGRDCSAPGAITAAKHGVVIASAAPYDSSRLSAPIAEAEVSVRALKRIAGDPT